MSVFYVIGLGLFVGFCYLVGQGTNNAAAVATGGFFIGVVALYFMPAIIANSSQHPNRVAITVLNIFLGWTLLGWVIALVWAYTAKPEATNGASSPQPATAPSEGSKEWWAWEDAAKRRAGHPPAATPEFKQCPFCAEDVKAAAIKCKHCGSDLSLTAAKSR